VRNLFYVQTDVNFTRGWKHLKTFTVVWFQESRNVTKFQLHNMGKEAQRWWSKDTVAVVTGANKGMAFEIVRQLAKEGITVVLTARDTTRGEEAL
jgi:3-oxoacyl-ACP reductase-like protein